MNFLLSFHGHPKHTRTERVYLHLFEWVVYVCVVEQSSQIMWCILKRQHHQNTTLVRRLTRVSICFVNTYTNVDLIRNMEYSPL